MSSYVLGFQEIDRTQLTLAGGKGANLGELSRLEGTGVPDGFCVSTETFIKTLGQTSSINKLLDQLSRIKIEERDKTAKLSHEIRTLIEGMSIPHDIIEEIQDRLDEKTAYAVRSSATAEDLPTASFAGQQDTYLNIIGKEAVLKTISKCWASLFSDRAIVYRIQNGLDHHKISMAVIIQKMVQAQVSGIMFTADPSTSNRRVTTIDAGFGLGEALVSGLVNADIYKVNNGTIIEKRISTKKLAIYAAKDGGTKEQVITPEKWTEQALTDEQIVRLEHLGRKIEGHFGHPQDIEWCLVEDRFYIVQSRPITTLYPIPETNDLENHVYISVGHQQMMIDAIKPLGLSFYLLTTPAPMRIAGGRLFVDITQMLASPVKRKVLLDPKGPFLGQHDPLIKDALTTVLEREFVKSVPEEQNQGPTLPTGPQAQINNDPADLIKRSQESIEALKQNIRTRSGPDLFDFIVDDIQQMKQFIFAPQNMAVIMAAINASGWINENMEIWLGEKNAASTLSESVPNNITSEMGMELLDVADVIRPYPDVIDYLQKVKNDNFPDELVKVNGGKEAQAAINHFLNKYGMRCAGEIDITRPRFKEKPTTLLPLILSNIKNFGPDESKKKFEQGRCNALKKEQSLLTRLQQLPDGEQKTKETKQMIDLMRGLLGYREYPKYSIVNRYFIYKQAILQEAQHLLAENLIREIEDIYYLTFDELRDVASTQQLDYQLINKRKDEYRVYEKLIPPRVITSDGEIIRGEYKRENLPSNTLPGLPVSAGVVEGRARVIRSLDEATLEDGDILVTSFTDPSWTPLFLSVKGLVAEVGGMNTHGAVIAREYGLPAVIGVENATSLIKNGQRIRINGNEGYVEIL